jgi:tetratricopeptide (TPR) repeat protein
VGLGRIYTDLKQYDLAIKAYKTAIKIDSTYDSALGNLGWAYYCAGNFKECINYSYKALQFDKEAVYAMFNIPLATLRLGDFEKAKKLYGEFIVLCKKNGYEITKGAEEDLNDLIKAGIMKTEAEFILSNYFRKGE